MTGDEIRDVLEKHAAWLRGEGGECANLRHTNLEGADLNGANLWGADLRGADLRGANLDGANLERANMVGAFLDGANLERANMVGADLWCASLDRANLVGADLDDADLDGANLRRANLWGIIVGDNQDRATGTIGGYWYLTFIGEDGKTHLRYGCEFQPLPWWREQGPELSVIHGEDESHWRYVKVAIAAAEALEGK